MALPSHLYRDPALVLEAKQEHERRMKERSCFGCTHLDELFSIPFCSLNRNRCGKNMRKCFKYRAEGAK